MSLLALRQPLASTSRLAARRFASSSAPTLAQPARTIVRTDSPAAHPHLAPLSDGGKPGATVAGSSLSAAPSSDAAAAKPKPRRREIKSKKAALSITPEAVGRLRALSSSPTEPKLLRIGVKTRGCAGMAYHLEYVNPPGGKFDEVVEQDGVKVLIDSKALFSIIGSRMDWRDNRLSAGFVFDNPNIVDTCGCGESFNIKF
ncbi:Iron-sulfur assembly protein 1 [Vanrija pseudolonga]|uniref:Iron-sulfur assembly protein 1 n=1 Tax=Vanrija pseudolonga TaxID=143232 RepID=A0AAF0YCY6_9TREE|nr:Iron-sulfur assembly protein 1 [Vanrija pseudolonga]